MYALHKIRFKLSVQGHLQEGISYFKLLVLSKLLSSFDFT